MAHTINDDAIVQNFHMVFPHPRERNGSRSHKRRRLISNPFASMFRSSSHTWSEPAVSRVPLRQVAAPAPAQPAAFHQAPVPVNNEKLELEIQRLTQVVQDLERSVNNLAEHGLVAGGPARSVQISGRRRGRGEEHSAVLQTLLQTNLDLRRSIKERKEGASANGAAGADGKAVASQSNGSPVSTSPAPDAGGARHQAAGST